VNLDVSLLEFGFNLDWHSKMQPLRHVRAVVAQSWPLGGVEAVAGDVMMIMSQARDVRSNFSVAIVIYHPMSCISQNVQARVSSQVAQPHQASL
jgi:hypothetical protein